MRTKTVKCARENENVNGRYDRRRNDKIYAENNNNNSEENNKRKELEK